MEGRAAHSVSRRQAPPFPVVLPVEGAVVTALVHTMAILEPFGQGACTRQEVMPYECPKATKARLINGI
jgi:hypothetical protein